MRHADRTTKIEGADLPPVTRALIEGSVHNEQLRYADQNGNPTVSSLRYGSIDKERPARRHYSTFEAEFPNVATEDILEILGFDDEYETLKFQLDGWNSIRLAADAARAGDGDQGLVFSAETGFGKTAAFMGQIFHELGNRTNPADTAILVYPSRALLRDQLSTALKLATNLDEKPGFEQPSIGVWTGNIPYNPWRVTQGYKNLTSSHSGPRGTDQKLNIASHWDQERGDSGFYVGDQRISDEKALPFQEADARYEVYTDDQNRVFSDHDLVLDRDGIRQQTSYGTRPQVLFTTLESLENIGLKPHYNIVANADFFVFDEIHQYTGLRGSHAANIIQNVRWARKEHEQSTSDAVFIGASATVANPREFATDLFGFDSKTAVEHIDPYPIDIDEENDDRQHFYFMLTPYGDTKPGVASQYIQQALLTGHSLIKNGDRMSKMLNFIDSVSQVNRLRHQLADAKASDLYKHHLGSETGDWDRVATLADRDFQPDFKDPISVYSGSNTSISEIIDADIVNSTSLLEIGVDIGDIEFVGQYREPRNLTTFMQRAGRAARKPGTDAHVQVFLSAFAGDQNFYYRADRFLNGQIHTPLNAENEVVEWIHRRYREIYSGIQTIQQDDREGSNWNEPSNEEPTLRRVFVDELGYDRFFRFLQNPSRLLEEALDEDVGGIEPLYSSSDADRKIRDVLTKVENDARNQLRQHGAFSDGDEGSNPPATETQARIAVNRAIQHLESLIEVIEQNDLDRDRLRVDAETSVEALGEVLDESLAVQLDTLDDAIQTLGEAKFALRRTEHEAFTEEEFDELAETVEYLQADNVENHRDRLSVVNYLFRFLECVDQYRSEDYAVHGSLLMYKHLLRGAYFVNRALQTVEDEYQAGVRIGTEYLSDESAKFWYIPENYFDDAGRHFTLREARTDRSGSPRESEESVDALFRKYIPFKSEYLDSVGTLQTFRPEVVAGENNRHELKLSEEQTYFHKGVNMPEQVSLTPVRDYSGSEGDGIHAVDPETKAPLAPDEVDERDEDEIEYAKLYSEPEISNEVELVSADDEFGDLTVGAVDAKVLLDAVDLQVTLQEEESPGTFQPKGEDVDDQRFVADTDFGYALETVGVRWDLSEYIDTLTNTTKGERIVERAKRYGKFETVSVTEAAHVTAAHFLTLFISDVTGIGTQMLMYGYDEASQTVHVFDKTQGGQGIIELFFDELDRNPAAGLNSLYRLLHNEQILNDGFWADTSILDTGTEPWESVYEEVDLAALRGGENERDEEIDTLCGFASGALNITYRPTLERIAEEIASTVERIAHLSGETGIDRRRLYELKHDLARARFEDAASADEIPEDLLTEYDDVFGNPAVEQETVRTLLYPPDVDDCKSNLQLSQTVIDADQEEVLSYTLLTQLKEHVVSRIPVSDEDELHANGRYWGRVVDNELEYFSWGEE